MIVITWNTQGIYDEDTQNAVRELKRKYKASVMALFETRCIGKKAN